MPHAPVAERLETRSLLSGSLSGIVYDDLRADGLSPGDPPVPGQTVELYRYWEIGLFPERTTLTGADGRYTFNDLPDGEYEIRVITTPGRRLTDGRPITVRLPDEGPPEWLNVSTYVPATISGVVFHDVDHDGARDAGEPPVSGAVLWLDWDYDGRRDPPVVTTGADGVYRFDNLGPDSHRVRIEPPPGYTPDRVYRQVEVLSGGDATNHFALSRPPTLSGLTLINAGTDQPVGPLVHGATINLADYNGRLNLRADVAPGLLPRDVGSVRFNLDGHADYRVENSAPYTIGGDNAGDYAAWRVQPGTHTLVVTPYARDDAAGQRGAPLTLTFNVIDTTPNPAARPVRVNAGGPAYVTTGGDAFAPDSGFLGGIARRFAFDIAGTDDDRLYSTHRAGPRMTFSRIVPSGTYTLRLHFAEPSIAATPGRRVFDVFAEGARVLDDYDIAAEAGPRTAVVKQFPVRITDRQLNLSFIASRETAVISAIELLPTTAVPFEPAPVLIDAGGAAPLTDSVARVFGADTAAGGFAGGTAVATPFDVENTTDDALFSSHRAGQVFTLRRPVANGNYSLILGFAEPVEGAAVGARKFDVFAEGRRILDDYDVVKEAGAARTAVAEAFDLSVTDGALDLTFRGVVGDAIVSSLVLLPTDVPDAAKPYSLERLSDNARQVVSSNNLRQLAQGVFLYANEWKGKFPADLETLVPYFDTIAPFSSPRTTTRQPRGEVTPGVEQAAWVEAHDDYLYLGAGMTYRDTWNVRPLIYENPRKVAGPIVIAFTDGHVEVVPRDEAAELIGFDPAPPTSPAPPPPDPNAPPYRPDPEVVTSRDHLFQLWRALRLSATENRGNLPVDWGRVFESQDVTLGQFLNPRDDTTPPPAGLTVEEQAEWIIRNSDYVYAGTGRYYATPADVAIAWENPSEMDGGINLLFTDGRVEFREMRWAVETIRRSLAWTRAR